MPLIFAENEASESDIRYTDKTGVQYQFPRMYRTKVLSGERFIYYRGRKKASGSRQPQVYFGTGIVGDVRDDVDHPNRMLAEILDYTPFPMPLFFKNTLEEYYEVGGSRRGYFQQGVRRVTDREYEAILKDAAVTFGLSDLVAARSPDRDSNPGEIRYGTSEKNALVERFSLDHVLLHLEQEFPDSKIVEKARNNPGFDIAVYIGSDLEYIEVKGTTSATPQFFISEGERAFSRRHHERYRLYIVYGINFSSGDCKMVCHRGAVDAEKFSIRPYQWICSYRRHEW